MNTIPQVLDPAVRTIRTIIQAIPGVLVLAALYPTVVTAIGIPKDSNVGLWITGSVTVVGAIAAALARIMAIPQVNALFAKINLAGHSGAYIGTADNFTRLVPVQTPATDALR